jgi:hypothetical protein
MKTLQKNRYKQNVNKFYHRKWFLCFEVCLKRNVDFFKTVKQSNPKDVSKWRHDKNRSDLGKKKGIKA